ncbi:ABC-F type ribosomal protection protein [Neobacillus piezotolerans]|uniref:ABC-F type ribosomal protection protein n=1 Tax=Neobacillus piezotolerans TaxID=2259171 RepID=A0A3D8GST5_9BACI|nr:ABC-F type ribosomal protection protein [Neobacillus piezotolerans]RDU37372.1 ABC-F type ribosomal protection protein [Neobacillus piezotolerans]
MELIKAINIKKSFGERELLGGVSFDIRDGEKIGLVGWNGSGKTTLVKLLTGELEPDGGTFTKRSSSLRIGYLPQSTDYDLSTLENEKGKTLLETASQLGLEKIREWEDSRLGSLSGGERLKLALAGVWAENPGLLILDEPTNHLDLKGLNWLIQSIKNSPQAALIISHDRHFLDVTVSKIFELEDGKLTVYDGNYTDYRAEKKRRHEQQVKEFHKQQQRVELINEQVAQLKRWSEKSHREAGKGRSPSENRQTGFKEYGRVQAKKKDAQIKSKLKRLNHELSKENIEKPKDELSIRFDFEAAGNRGKRILEARGLGKSFAERILFEKSHFYIKHGERIALLGSNGAGKTTFIKMLLGELSASKGSLWKSDSVRIAYLSQDVGDLPGDRTVLDFMGMESLEQRTKARTLFANMGMKEEKLSNPFSALSLGERTRVKLVHLIMQEYDMLVLDEPTNHLDLPSREQMEETLASYSGTLLIVSHDRYFVERLCDKLLVIENNRIQRIEMGLREYEERQFAQARPDNRNREEELALLDTKIAELLGKISMLTPESHDYANVDKELNKLIQQKQSLI